MKERAFGRSVTMVTAGCVLAGFFYALIGCTSKVSTEDKIIKSKIPISPKVTSSDITRPEEVVPFSNEEAFTYLTKSCGGCHGPEGSYRANWDLPAQEKLSVATLEGVAGITRAYQAIANKYDGNEGASPSAMPLGVDFISNQRAKIDAGRMLKWFAEAMPTIVKDANFLYPTDEESGSKLVTTSEVTVSLNYKCKQVRTGISYLTKLTSSLYQRNPTNEEIALLGDEAQVPISEAKRKLLASRIKEPNSPARLEFQEVGLRTFAQKIADAAEIDPAEIDPAAQRTAIQQDLKDEFYQLLLKYYTTTPYRDILLLNKVMVTSNTAPLYENCGSPQPDTWSECTLSEERSNYFGTVSYLRAKPSSFLENGNNYGRAGSMFIVASGEALLPQTNGPVGVEVNGLPQCLTESTKDARARKNELAKPGEDEPLTGPYGTMTVPGFGNVCQGCHVRRGLAAGSKVYRPFGKFGEKLTEQVLDEACNAQNPGGECRFNNQNNSVYKDDLMEAIADDKANYINAGSRFATAAPAQKARGGDLDATEPVTVGFLKSLLGETAGGAKTCIPVDSKTVKEVNSIKEMAEFVVGSAGNVSRGLSRLIPKAVAGTQVTNQEVIMAVNKASSESNGMLEDMIIAYLTTETFACQEE